MFWQQKQTFNNHTKEKKILVVLGCRSLCKAAQVNNAVFSIQYVEKRTKDNSGEKPEVLGSLAALEFGKRSRNSTEIKETESMVRHHTSVSGSASVLSEESSCQICQRSLCQSCHSGLCGINWASVVELLDLLCALLFDLPCTRGGS